MREEVEIVVKRNPRMIIEVSTALLILNVLEYYRYNIAIKQWVDHRQPHYIFLAITYSNSSHGLWGDLYDLTTQTTIPILGGWTIINLIHFIVCISVKFYTWQLKINVF